MCRKEVQPFLALCNFFGGMVTAKQTLLFPDYNHDVLLSNMEYLKSLSHLAKRAGFLSTQHFGIIISHSSILLNIL